MTLFLDLDGVLADFDAGAQRALRTDNSYKWEWVHGADAFWQVLNSNPNFFAELPPMEDAMVLWEAVAHLNLTILTALPRKDADDVDRQKRGWVASNLGTDVSVITCTTYEKPNYCAPGDVLVDDRSVNRALWQQRGGAFVHHTSAAETLAVLQDLSII